MLRKLLLAGVLFAATTGLQACSDSNDPDFSIPDYTGIWDLRYNLFSDECALVAGFAPGFVDQHRIIQQQRTIELSAVSLFIVTEQGRVREDNSLLAEDRISGDILGDGTPCTLDVSVSYDNLQDDSADSLFAFNITCADGWSCESHATGEARRQPATTPTEQNT